MSQHDTTDFGHRETETETEDETGSDDAGGFMAKLKGLLGRN